MSLLRLFAVHDVSDPVSFPMHPHESHLISLNFIHAAAATAAKNGITATASISPKRRPNTLSTTIASAARRTIPRCRRFSGQFLLPYLASRLKIANSSDKKIAIATRTHHQVAINECRPQQPLRAPRNRPKSVAVNVDRVVRRIAVVAPVVCSEKTALRPAVVRSTAVNFGNAFNRPRNHSPAAAAAAAAVPATRRAPRIARTNLRPPRRRAKHQKNVVAPRHPRLWPC